MGKRSDCFDIVVFEKCGWKELFHVESFPIVDGFLVWTVVCEMTVGTTYTAIA
jgi:hypothetical protein